MRYIIQLVATTALTVVISMTAVAALTVTLSMVAAMAGFTDRKMLIDPLEYMKKATNLPVQQIEDLSMIH